MNLIEKLGLEKCKAIVERHRNLGTHFTKFKYYSVKKDDFFLSQLFIDFICVDDLRTAIANHECDHDWEDISCNSDLERQLICTYCSMKKSEPFALNVKRWSEEDTDHCTDIRNHISPNTKVIER